MSERYKVVKGSDSGHCCFTATVVDTTTVIGHLPDRYENVCECFDEEWAGDIAAMLNEEETARTTEEPSHFFLDAFGKTVDVQSTIMYKTGGGHGEWIMLLINQTGCNTLDGCWEIRGTTPFGHCYSLYGHMGERHPRMAALAASATEVLTS